MTAAGATETPATAASAAAVKQALSSLDVGSGLLRRGLLLQILTSIGVKLNDAELMLNVACPTPVTDVPYREVIDWIFADATFSEKACGCEHQQQQQQQHAIVIHCTRVDAASLLAACQLCLPSWASVAAEAVHCEVLSSSSTGTAVVRVSAISSGPQPPVVVLRLSRRRPVNSGCAALKMGMRERSWSLAEAAAEALGGNQGGTLGARVFLAADRRAPGVAITEFIGEPVYDSPGPGWLDPGSADELGRLLGALHSMPDAWFDAHEALAQHTLCDAGYCEVLQLWSAASKLAGAPPSAAEWNEAWTAVGRYGHFALDIYGAALALERSLNSGSGWSEQLKASGAMPLRPQEQEQLRNSFVAARALVAEACGLLEGRPLLGRLVVGHCDLHALNILRRESDGSLAMIGFEAPRRAIASVDLSHCLSLFVLEPELPYPSLQTRRAMVHAYAAAVSSDASLREGSAASKVAAAVLAGQGECSAELDELVLDLEKGAVLNALLAAVAGYLTLGPRQHTSWGFLGIASRAISALRSVATGNAPKMRARLLHDGVRPVVLGPSRLQPFSCGGVLRWRPGFWNDDLKTARLWFPDVEPPDASFLDA